VSYRLSNRPARISSTVDPCPGQTDTRIILYIYRKHQTAPRSIEGQNPSGHPQSVSVRADCNRRVRQRMLLPFIPGGLPSSGRARWYTRFRDRGGSVKLFSSFHQAAIESIRHYSNGERIVISSFYAERSLNECARRVPLPPFSSVVSVARISARKRGIESAERFFKGARPSLLIISFSVFSFRRYRGRPG